MSVIDYIEWSVAPIPRAEPVEPQVKPQGADASEKSPAG